MPQWIAAERVAHERGSPGGPWIPAMRIDHSVLREDPPIDPAARFPFPHRGLARRATALDR